VRRSAALATTLLAMVAGSAGAARADLRICNTTQSRIGVALGFFDGQNWTTEGWWNLKPSSCETLLKGKLPQQFYYVHAVDYDRGGEWGGSVKMCVRDREFTINGNRNCLARGFDQVGFFEVDTGQQENWTVELRDPGQAPASTRP
jgi:uncharacterized membrane protein